MTEYSVAKTGEYPRKFPNFQNCTCCEKDLKDNKHNRHHLARKYVRIFVPGHYPFLEAHSFPRGKLRFVSRNVTDISVYTLSDLGVLSNLLGSLSLANEH